MMTILGIGLAVSLSGPLLMVLAVKRFSLNGTSLLNRLLLWLLALVVLVTAAKGDGSWLLHIGVRSFGWSDILGIVVAVVVMLAGAIILPQLVTKLGFKGSMESDLRTKIYSLSGAYRLFMVITAAVTEEILYRGYAIGVGQEIWGSLTFAFIVSLLVFVIAHYTHGAKALVTVFWISMLMSLLFVVTNNLFDCIIAHFVMDAFGVLFVPWVMARQRAQGMSLAEEGKG